MRYDPVKKSLGKVFNKTPYLRILLYRLLDLLLLRSWYVRKEIKKWVKTAPENSSVLDAGSGFGQYVWRLSKLSKNIQITGIDVKSEQIYDCNTFFSKIGLSERVIFKEADLTRINDFEQYNLILSIDVMEHIKEDELVFSNFFNSLKKDGTLIISTPSDKGGSDAENHSDNKVAGFIDEHVRDGYNMYDLEEKLHRAGFNNVKSKYMYGIPGNIAWKLSMKYPILMLNLNKLFFIILPFYYLLTFPIALILNILDLKLRHEKGTGLIVVARK